MGFFDIFKKKKKEIKRVRFLFDYCSNNIFFYDSDDNMLSWGNSLIPPEWQKDKTFMNLNKQVCDVYDSLFKPNKLKIDFIGFKDGQQKKEFENIVDEFVDYVIAKCGGKYEISNDYHIENL